MKKVKRGRKRKKNGVKKEGVCREGERSGCGEVVSRGLESWIEESGRRGWIDRFGQDSGSPTGKREDWIGEEGEPEKENGKRNGVVRVSGVRLCMGQVVRLVRLRKGSGRGSRTGKTPKDHQDPTATCVCGEK